MTIEDRLRSHLRSTEVDSTIPDPDLIIRAAHHRTRRSRAVGIFAGAGLVLAGVLGAASMMGESSVVDLADVPSTTVVEAAEQGEEPADDDTDLSEDEFVGEIEADADDSFSAADAATLPFGPSRPVVVGVEDGFVGLRSDPAGVRVLRSADGSSWSESPTVGFPDGQIVFSGNLVHSEGVYAVVVLDFSAEEPGPGILATSTNLADWTTVELASEDGTQSFVQGLALAGEQIVVAAGAYPDFIDPTAFAIELGLIDAEQAERSCGVSWDGPEDPIEIVDCEGDEPLVVVTPDEPGHGALFEAASSAGEPEEPEGEILLWSGVVGEDLAPQRLDTSGFASPTVVASASGFGLFDASGESATVRRSSDGVGWSAPVPVSGDWYQPVNVAELAIGARIQDQAAFITSVSLVDGKQLTVEVPLGPDYSFGWISSARQGPAGAAMLVVGMPGMDGFPELGEFPESVSLTVDGFTLETALGSGPFIVTAPDGTVIHDLPDGSSIIDDAQDMAGVARFDGADDERLVILDPQTGEDLFTVTQEAFFEAMGLDIPFDDLDAGGEPEAGDQSATLLFSPDGISWKRIDGLPDFTAESFASIEAIGDDEILIRVDQMMVPPDGLFLENATGEATPEQLEALAEWEAAQQESSVVVRIPLG